MVRQLPAAVLRRDILVLGRTAPGFFWTTDAPLKDRCGGREGQIGPREGPPRSPGGPRRSSRGTPVARGRYATAPGQAFSAALAGQRMYSLDRPTFSIERSAHPQQALV